MDITLIFKFMLVKVGMLDIPTTCNCFSLKHLTLPLCITSNYSAILISSAADTYLFITTAQERLITPEAVT